MIEQTASYALYEESLRLDGLIAILDPLGLDDCFSSSFALMAENGAEGVCRFIHNHLVRFRLEEVGMSSQNALAAQRDLGFFLGAISRHGVKAEHNSALERALLILAQITEEDAPDTVWSYSTRNPRGNRTRLFTGLKEERDFVLSLDTALKSLYLTIAGLEALSDFGLDDPLFGLLVRESALRFSEMSTAIQGIRKTVAPEVFSGKIRPFFDPRYIGEKKYNGSNGAQMPMIVLDSLIWAEDEGEDYLRYREENLGYSPPNLLKHFNEVSRRKSLVSRVREVSSKKFSEAKREVVRSSLLGLADMATAVIGFRSPHLTLAVRNMAVRPEGSVGSGGYDLNVLRQLLTKTVEAKKFFQNAADQL